MLSIIVCSIRENFFLQVSQSLQQTIGDYTYEIIKINNLVEKLSLTEAYNKGIKKSKFPILVFVHEDVLFHTHNWGKILLSYFENDPKLGLVGVAGSKIKTRFPSAWWENQTEHLSLNIFQKFSNGETKFESFGFKNGPTSEVVIIDGVFMAMRKDKRIFFNEALKGFHNYDQSISFDFKRYGYKIITTCEIDIEHFSTGSIDDSWVKSSLKFHQLYNKYLPLSIGQEITKEDRAYSCLKFIGNCKRTGHKKLAFRYWLKYLVLKPFSKKNYAFLKYFLNWD
ncbi:glycosyltransferase [Salegentibacter agarivorans]